MNWIKIEDRLPIIEKEYHVQFEWGVIDGKQITGFGKCFWKDEAWDKILVQLFGKVLVWGEESEKNG